MKTKKVQTKKPAPSSEKKIRLSDRRWGTSVMARGYTIVPALLLRAQGKLRISGMQLAIIVHIIDHWWTQKEPWVSYDILGVRLSASHKVIQRNLKDLEDRELVKRKDRFSNGRRISNGFDFSGLIVRLKALAPEFAEAAQAKKKVEEKGSPVGAKKKKVL